MTQTSFAFDSATPAPAPAASPGRAKAKPSAEAMAQLLELHPDYRVQRRLVPVKDYGPAPAGATLRQVLVLDTETTGLSHQSDKIIELAMLLVSVDAATGRPWGPVMVFEGFEDPGMPIPPIALQVTGITDEQVKGQRLDDDAVRALVQRADLIVAHNAGFDRPFVEARFAFFADKRWACSFADIDWKAAGAGSAKLSALAQDQGWFFDAHRAQVDCHALLQVLSRPVPPSTTGTGLLRLLNAAAQPSYKLRAINSPFETKDALKARGYRWDGEARVWAVSLSGPALLEQEIEWLKAEVYGRRSARVEVEALDSAVRYSARPGRVEERVL